MVLSLFLCQSCAGAEAAEASLSSSSPLSTPGLGKFPRRARSPSSSNSSTDGTHPDAGGCSCDNTTASPSSTLGSTHMATPSSANEETITTTATNGRHRHPPSLPSSAASVTSSTTTKSRRVVRSRGELLARRVFGRNRQDRRRRSDVQTDYRQGMASTTTPTKSSSGSITSSGQEEQERSEGDTGEKTSTGQGVQSSNTDVVVTPPQGCSDEGSSSLVDHRGKQNEEDRASHVPVAGSVPATTSTPASMPSITSAEFQQAFTKIVGAAQCHRYEVMTSSEAVQEPKTIIDTTSLAPLPAMSTSLGTGVARSRSGTASIRGDDSYHSAMDESMSSLSTRVTSNPKQDTSWIQLHPRQDRDDDDSDDADDDDLLFLPTTASHSFVEHSSTGCEELNRSSSSSSYTPHRRQTLEPYVAEMTAYYESLASDQVSTGSLSYSRRSQPPSSLQSPIVTKHLCAVTPTAGVTMESPLGRTLYTTPTVLNTDPVLSSSSSTLRVVGSATGSLPTPASSPLLSPHKPVRLDLPCMEASPPPRLPMPRQEPRSPYHSHHHQQLVNERRSDDDGDDDNDVESMAASTTETGEEENHDLLVDTQQDYGNVELLDDNHDVDPAAPQATEEEGDAAAGMHRRHTTQPSKPHQLESSPIQFHGDVTLETATVATSN